MPYVPIYLSPHWIVGMYLNRVQAPITIDGMTVLTQPSLARILAMEPGKVGHEGV
jgi:hypothetical protein